VDDALRTSGSITRLPITPQRLKAELKRQSSPSSQRSSSTGS
jgi:hypothetical protein